MRILEDVSARSCPAMRSMRVVRAVPLLALPLSTCNEVRGAASGGSWMRASWVGCCWTPGGRHIGSVMSASVTWSWSFGQSVGPTEGRDARRTASRASRGGGGGGRASPSGLACTIRPHDAGDGEARQRERGAWGDRFSGRLHVSPSLDGSLIVSSPHLRPLSRAAWTRSGGSAPAHCPRCIANCGTLATCIAHRLLAETGATNGVAASCNARLPLWLHRPLQPHACRTMQSKKRIHMQSADCANRRDASGTDGSIVQVQTPTLTLTPAQRKLTHARACNSRK